MRSKVGGRCAIGRLSDSSLDHGLRAQHVAHLRAGYDGHRRHSGLTTMHHVRVRRSRRMWHQRLITWRLAMDLQAQLNAEKGVIQKREPGWPRTPHTAI